MFVFFAALKYPVGPVQPKGASGYAPKAAPEEVGEPDYAALARGEPGFPEGSQQGEEEALQGVPSGSRAISGLPPSVTGATSGYNLRATPFSMDIAVHFVTASEPQTCT